jgi:hypothetical protein
MQPGQAVWASAQSIFFGVYDVAPLCLQWPLAQLFPAAWAGDMGQMLSLSFIDVVPLCLQWPLAQLFLAAWAVCKGQCAVYCFQCL